ncbi:hypothetical protein OPV22_022501 [Ensete ventricosum]|uniref:Uncharacterized protein n=1 Tax=Ensete ventricosum TaxID=4639 RepID=A0AAV8QFS1_ENSVE|nr:hypothetical protein OPV22_022501 [Ensete ventricosum]
MATKASPSGPPQPCLNNVPEKKKRFPFRDLMFEVMSISWLIVSYGGSHPGSDLHCLFYLTGKVLGCCTPVSTERGGMLAV